MSTSFKRIDNDWQKPHFFEVGMKVAVENRSRYSYQGHAYTVTKVTPAGTQVTVSKVGADGVPVSRVFNAKSLKEVGANQNSWSDGARLIPIETHERAIAHQRADNARRDCRRNIQNACEKLQEVSKNDNLGNFDEALAALVALREVYASTLAPSE